LSGRYVSPSLHRQSALHRDGGRVAGASVQRRCSHVRRPSRRSRDRPSARIRVRRLRRPRRCGRSDSQVRSGGPGAPRPGGFSSPRPGGAPGGFSSPRPGGAPGGFAPRPGGFSPRPAGLPGEAPRGTKNFGPDAPPKHKRKPQGKERDKPKGPIKQRPISSLYDADEDWRSLDAKEDDVEMDNIATHKDAEDKDVDDEAEGGEE
jgi:hypothetical protein